MKQEAHILLEEVQRQYPYGSLMQKKSGSSWRGRVVGYYSTDLTEHGLAIESDFEPGSVQIYPLKALISWDGNP